MQVKFKLDKTDLLQSRLFALSKSPQVQKQRRKNHIAAMLSFLAVALFCLLLGQYVIAIGMAIATVGWYFIYPGYERGSYVRRELEHITQALAKLEHGETVATFEEQGINWQEIGMNSHISFDLLEQMTETDAAIYLLLKPGNVIPLPKQKILQSESLIVYLKALADKLQIPYQTHFGWTWR